MDVVWNIDDVALMMAFVMTMLATRLLPFHAVLGVYLPPKAQLIVVPSLKVVADSVILGICREYCQVEAN